MTCLIHLIPCGVKITLDNMTCECFATDVDLDIGVTLAFYHAPHQVIFRNKILPSQQVNSKQSLKKYGHIRRSMCNLLLKRKHSKM